MCQMEGKVGITCTRKTYKDISRKRHSRMGIMKPLSSVDDCLRIIKMLAELKFRGVYLKGYLVRRLV